MPLFGKHTKSAELGMMARSLGTGALAALTTKGSGQDPYAQSGGITEGGEEGGGGPTGMDRLGAFAAGMGSKGYMDYLGKQSKADYSSAQARLANEAAAKAKQEREAESVPFNIAEATGQLDSTGSLEAEVNKIAELGGHNANGGAFTRKEYSEAIQKPGFAADIAAAITKTNQPLSKLVNTQERELQEGLAKYKDETTGKVNIEQIMSNPDVLGENPKLAKLFENWQANRTRHKKANEGLSYFETMAARAAPITTQQMQASAHATSISTLMNMTPGMTKATATAIHFAKEGEGFNHLRRVMSTFGALPTREQVINGDYNDENWEAIGPMVMPKAGVQLDPMALKRAYLNGIDALSGDDAYMGGGSTKNIGGGEQANYEEEINQQAPTSGQYQQQKKGIMSNVTRGIFPEEIAKTAIPGYGTKMIYDAIAK